ncbi:hypothetical protein PFISCL1PPCAC_295, partial [Pristionchus fissidentatus]
RGGTSRLGASEHAFEALRKTTGRSGGFHRLSTMYSSMTDREYQDSRKRRAPELDAYPNGFKMRAESGYTNDEDDYEEEDAIGEAHRNLSLNDSPPPPRPRLAGRREEPHSIYDGNNCLSLEKVRKNYIE